MMQFYLMMLCYLSITSVAVDLPYGETNSASSHLLQALKKLRKQRGVSCPSPDMCVSKWGFCGVGPEYCGNGCKVGNCGSQEVKITNVEFKCIFNTLDNKTLSKRYTALTRSNWRAHNRDELAVFLAHVYHETDGLKTLVEYCAPGCGPRYATSWCGIKTIPEKLYYGRGWLQLSYPCNYDSAGKSMGLDLLKNPDLVIKREDVALKSALWFYNANNMATPARSGDFAATTRIINGPQECNGGPGIDSQKTRVATYLRVRKYLGLTDPSKDPMC